MTRQTYRYEAEAIRREGDEERRIIYSICAQDGKLLEGIDYSSSSSSSSPLALFLPLWKSCVRIAKEGKN